MEYPSVHAYECAVAPAPPTVPQVTNPGYTSEQPQLRTPSHHASIFHELSGDIKLTEVIDKQSGSTVAAANGTVVGRGGTLGKAVAGSEVKARKLRKSQEQGSDFMEKGTLDKKKHWWSKRSSIIA